jgi:recombination protein RecA
LTEVYGEPGTGKSTLVATIIGQHQKNGGVAVLFDTEAAFLPEQATRIGVDVDKLIYAQPAHLQDLFGMMELSINRIKASKDPRPLLIVWDSVAATPTKEELEGEFGASHMGLHARLISQALRKLIGLISKERVALLFVNQAKSSLGDKWGDQIATLGGFAIPFHASVRIYLKRIGFLQDGSYEKYGILLEAETKKNKVSPPFKKSKVQLEFARGIVDEATWIEFLTVRGLIGRKGSWYYFRYPETLPIDPTSDTYLKLQYQGYLKKLEAEPEFKAYLKRLVVENYAKKPIVVTGSKDEED